MGFSNFKGIRGAVFQLRIICKSSAEIQKNILSLNVSDRSAVCYCKRLTCQEADFHSRVELTTGLVALMTGRVKEYI